VSDVEPRQPWGPNRLVRRVRLWAQIPCALLLAAIIAGWFIYVNPQVDRVRHADAIFVLGGYGYGRYIYGMNLGASGWAPNLVISNPMGSGDRYLSEYCATPHPNLGVRCFVPNPSSTQGEGRELRRLARQYGWHNVIVVTFRPHISRARFILERCFDGDLIMVASQPDMSLAQWAFQYTYQTAGYVKALLEREC
jgi:uncharacterized SAM-binding protein YcdF (DUF218 family)